jgi:hypothetical protein
MEYRENQHRSNVSSPYKILIVTVTIYQRYIGLRRHIWDTALFSLIIFTTHHLKQYWHPTGKLNDAYVHDFLAAT